MNFSLLSRLFHLWFSNLHICCDSWGITTIRNDYRFFFLWVDFVGQTAWVSASLPLLGFWCLLNRLKFDLLHHPFEPNDGFVILFQFAVIYVAGTLKQSPCECLVFCFNSFDFFASHTDVHRTHIDYWQSTNVRLVAWKVRFCWDRLQSWLTLQLSSWHTRPFAVRYLDKLA